MAEEFGTISRRAGARGRNTISFGKSRRTEAYDRIAGVNDRRSGVHDRRTGLNCRRTVLLDSRTGLHDRRTGVHDGRAMLLIRYRRRLKFIKFMYMTREPKA